MEDSKSFQSSWTLAQAMIFDIAEHLKRGRNFWLAGNLDKYYWEFECVVRILKGLIEEKEKEEAERKEEEIVKYIPMIIQTKEKRTNLIKLLKEYDEMVMTFIHSHHMDMPPKRDRTVMIA